MKLLIACLHDGAQETQLQFTEFGQNFLHDNYAKICHKVTRSIIAANIQR
jgi:hypothetical protein